MTSPKYIMEIQLLQSGGNEREYMSDYIVEMRHITKRFPGIVANDDVTIQVKKGRFTPSGGKRRRKVNADEYAFRYVRAG